MKTKSVRLKKLKAVVLATLIFSGVPFVSDNYVYAKSGDSGINYGNQSPAGSGWYPTPQVNGVDLSREFRMYVSEAHQDDSNGTSGYSYIYHTPVDKTVNGVTYKAGQLYLVQGFSSTAGNGNPEDIDRSITNLGEASNIFGSGTSGLTDEQEAEVKSLISHIDYDQTIDGDQIINGDSELNGNVTVDEDLTVNGDTYMNGDATVEKDLTVNGDTYMNGDATVEKDLTVNGDTYMNGDATVEKDLTVNGDTYMNGDAMVEKDLTVNGDTFMNGNATVDKDLTVNGNSSVKGDFNVDGKSNFNDDVTMQKNLSVAGDANIGGDLTAKTIYADDAIIGGRSINQQFADVDQHINETGALSAALAGLHPRFQDGNKGELAMAYGGYGGQSAYALGGFYAPNEKVMFSVGMSMAPGGRKMGNFGVNFALDRAKKRNEEAIDIVYTRKEVDSTLAAFRMQIEAQNKAFEEQRQAMVEQSHALREQNNLLEEQNRKIEMLESRLQKSDQE